jgi:threonine dehydrogenase-like Zn-dependent dehydrogenase
MMLDTPATIAIIGNGPIGLEAALYARFLGYQVILVGDTSLADMLAAGDNIELNLVLSDLSSTLGRAALAAHDEQQQFSLETSLLSCQSWYESYLGPLSKTDLLADQQQWQVTLESITLSENGLRLTAVDSDENLEVDAVFDVRGQSPAIDRLYCLPEVSLQDITPSSLQVAFGAGLSVIQKLFALLGGRQDLDLYDTVGYLPGAGDST